jgi:hypothetical protein
MKEIKEVIHIMGMTKPRERELGSWGPSKLLIWLTVDFHRLVVF